MRISALINRSEKFEFDFDGEKLTGEWYKYRTTTTSYLKALQAEVPDMMEDGTDAERLTARRARNEALERVAAKFLADTIKSWDAEGDDGESLLPSQEVFDSLPGPFVKFLADKFEELRTATVNPPTPSPNG